MKKIEKSEKKFSVIFQTAGDTAKKRKNTRAAAGFLRAVSPKNSMFGGKANYADTKNEKRNRRRGAFIKKTAKQERRGQRSCMMQNETALILSANNRRKTL